MWIVYAYMQPLELATIYCIMIVARQAAILLSVCVARYDTAFSQKTVRRGSAPVLPYLRTSTAVLLCRL